LDEKSHQAAGREQQAADDRGTGDHVTVSPRSIVVLSDPRRD